MKKLLPLILVAVGLIVVASVFIVSRFLNRGSEAPVEENALRELSLSELPFAALIPSKDGHELKLLIENIKVEGAAMLDYELLYTVADGRTQGVPGTVAISTGDVIERDLLLGSESSGKRRFDEGVEFGTLTLRFRDEDGRLIAKLSGDWHLQSGEETLTSSDGVFEHIVDEPEGVYFVVMDTFGEKGGTSAPGPHYGIFASDEREFEL